MIFNAHFSPGIISNEEESLFTYRANETFNSFFDPGFMPIFEPVFSSPELQQQAMAICNNDQLCLFDVAATGRLEVGLGTAQGNLEYNNIVMLTMPGKVFSRGKTTEVLDVLVAIAFVKNSKCKKM